MSDSDLWSALRCLRSRQSEYPLKQRSGDGPLELSFSQERIWHLAELDSSSSRHHSPYAWRLRGEISRQALQQSLQQIARRHQILRTSFFRRNGKPMQHPGALESTDLRCEPVDLHSGEVASWMEREIDKPFDLLHRPPWRAHLARLGPREHVLLLTIHSIAFDGWSESLLFRELEAFYRSFCKPTACSESPEMPELAFQYQDFAEWERRYLSSPGVLDSLQAAWAAELDSEIGPPPLGLEPEAGTDPGQRRDCQRTLPALLTRDLRTLSHSEGSTLFVTLLAVFAAHLHSLSGGSRFLVCSPVASRHQVGLQGVMGYFVNLVVLQCDLTGRPSFRELLSRFRRVAAHAFSYQDLPVQYLQRLPALRGSLSRVLFSYHGQPRRELALEDLEVESLSVLPKQVDFDLHLEVWPHGEELKVRLQYGSRILTDALAEEWLEAISSLLARVVARPDSPLEKPLLGESVSGSPTSEKPVSETFNSNGTASSCDFGTARLAGGASIASQLSRAVHGDDRRRLLRSYLLARSRQVLHLNADVLIPQTATLQKLGFDSLKLIQLATDMAEDFAGHVPLTFLSDLPTVESLAERLEGWWRLRAAPPIESSDRTVVEL